MKLQFQNEKQDLNKSNLNSQQIEMNWRLKEENKNMRNKNQEILKRLEKYKEKLRMANEKVV